jgi:hypothetical protein
MSFVFQLCVTDVTVGCKKKTGTVRIKLTHFNNFFIVGNFLTRDGLRLWLKFSHFKKLFDRYCEIDN